MKHGPRSKLHKIRKINLMGSVCVFVCMCVCAHAQEIENKREKF